MALREIFAAFGIEADTGPLKELNSAVDAAKAGLVGLGTAVGAAAGGIYAIVQQAADYEDELLKTSQRQNMAIDVTQKMAYALDLAGVKGAEAAATMKFLNRNLQDARDGSQEKVKAFRELGISMGEIKSLSADQMFLRIADGMQKLPSEGPKRAALAMELLGKAGVDALPALVKGSAEFVAKMNELEQLGAIVSLEDAQRAEEFNDSLTTLGYALRGIRNAAAAGFFEPFREIVAGVTQFLVVNREVIKTNLTGFVAGLAGFLKDVFQGFMLVARSVMGYVAAMGGAERATRAVLTLLAIMSGFALLISIGKLVSGIWNVVAAMRALNLSAMLIPALIGAGLVAIGLIADDVAAYFRGDDSVFGAMTRDFQKFLDVLAEKMPFLASAFRMIGDLHKKFWAPSEVQRMQSNIEFQGKDYMARQKAQGFEQYVSGLQGGFVAPSSASSGRWGEGLPAAAAAVTQNNSIQVIVPPQTPASQIPGAVERGTRRGTEDFLREAGRAVTPGVQ